MRSNSKISSRQAYWKNSWLPFAFTLIVLHLVTAQQVKAAAESAGGFLDFNFYPYVKVEGDNVFTMNVFAKLPGRFSYFSLSNFGNQIDRKEFSLGPLTDRTTTLYSTKKEGENT